ncbi:hypothetical protein [Polaribacter sp. Q13]|uniref:hypothetical protein n=1 Tax=Polaribacter sp. Q13 TaxID=2806551 RepID=UPI00193C61EF|nr:hypothetical protein [Polaribacter sp. Q13]QVY67408.1 hypothetical protein JOP69_09125 [Polaribacter sp. Q13]
MSVFIGIHKLKLYFNKLKKFNSYFIFFSVFIFLFLLFINLSIDGYSLNVDRWSAMEIGIKSLLEGKYPYAVLDHLGNTTSNFPGLFYLGLPFYLLGDVGLLQPFTLLLLLFFLFRLKIENYQKVIVLALLLFAPAYYWEIIVKSDFMSNSILLLLFISTWSSKFGKDIFKKGIFLAIISAFFVSTRGTVIIPLTLFLFSSFIKTTTYKKVLFSSVFIISLVLISLPIFINLPNFDFIIEHNPFNHQTRYAPQFLIITALIIPFILSFKISKTSDVFLYTIYILGGLVGISFILNCIEEGFDQNIYGNLFDLSYLSIVLPFILFYLMEEYQNIKLN